MSKPTEKEIEDKIAKEIYEVMSKQMFYDWYMNEDDKSFTAHISGDDDCPTKEDIIKGLKSLFGRVIEKTKELVNESAIQ